jgi:hypothetical protein
MPIIIPTRPKFRFRPVLVGGGGGGFTPASLPGLVSWLNPDSTPQSTFSNNPADATLPTNGQGFLSYLDQVGSGLYYHPGGNIMGWLNAANGHNGHATTFAFGGSATPMARAITLTDTSKLAIFSAILPNIAATSANFNRFFAITGNGAAADYDNLGSIAVFQDASTLNLKAMMNSIGTASYAMTLSTWFQFAIIVSGGVLSLYGGPSLALAGSYSIAANFGTTLTFRMGAYVDGSSSQNCQYGDVVVVNGDVSPTDFTNMKNWMAAKWAV